MVIKKGSDELILKNTDKLMIYRGMDRGREGKGVEERGRGGEGKEIVVLFC